MTLLARRAPTAPRPGSRRACRPVAEALETRSLLSADVTAVWAAPSQVAPESSALVKFHEGTSAIEVSRTLDAVGGRLVRTFSDGPSVVALPPWSVASEAVKTLSADPDVTYAEPNLTFQATAGASVSPNDPKAAEQWGLGLIDASAAWGITTGNASTIVAVLDTGIDTRSPEFSGRLWVNPAASSRSRTVYGWNFADNNTNVTDNNSHGTHVSGIIAAAGDNGNGVAGLNWNATIMPLKVLDANGGGSTDRAVSAIYFAVDNGAKVINASWGGDTFSQSMLDSLNYANAKGVVFVTAAGNEGVNNDVATSYPASYRLPNVLSVASVDRNGNLAVDSNYGGGTVDLAAPGVDIVSTTPGGFATYSGTSMATAFVSGTVSLLAGLRPDLSASQLVDRVRTAVKPLPALAGKTVSGGVVDPYEVLKNETPSPPPTPAVTPTQTRSTFAFPRFAASFPTGFSPTRRLVRKPARRPVR